MCEFKCGCPKQEGRCVACAVKTTALEALPESLIFHLQRGSYSDTAQKITDHVSVFESF